MPENYVPRAIQLDSAQLDHYFLQVINSNLNANFNRIIPEFKFLIQVYLWYKKLNPEETSIGLSTYQCCYDRLTLVQKCSFLLKYSLQYLKDRLGSNNADTQINRTMEKLILYFRILEMFNVYAFIYRGQYRNLHERIFRIRIRKKNPENRPHLIEPTSYSFLNRELTWNILIEVLTLLIPCITESSFYQTIVNRINRRFVQNLQTPHCDNNIQANKCAICSLPAMNARSYSGCKHIYCYLCIGQVLFEDEIHTCHVCHSSIRSMDELSQKYSQI